MIAKFETSDGWVYRPCESVRQYNEQIEINIDPQHYERSGFFVYGCDEVDFCKKAVLTTLSGEIIPVMFGLDAYLMNDNGDTICRL